MQVRGQIYKWDDQDALREMFQQAAKPFEKDRLHQLERSLDESWKEAADIEPDIIEDIYCRVVRSADPEAYLATMRYWALFNMPENRETELIWCHIAPSISSELEVELPVTWQQAITDSEKILLLEEDWDEMGGSTYDRSTWERAIDLLKMNVKELWASKQIWLSVPYIEPGPDGSIDLHWRTKSRELLVNIPADSTQPASYFGDELGKNCIKGHLDTNEYQEWMMLWLIK